MISEFHPIPEIGVQYKDKDNQIILVTAVEPEKGQNPDAVYYKTVPSSDDREYEALQDDWNLMGYVKIGSSEPIVEPDPKTNPQPYPEPNPNPQPEPEPEPVPSDGIYSNDPRINELAKLLQDGPKKFNQEFYPTDKTLSDNNMVEHDVEDAFQKTLDEIDELRDQGAYIDEPFIDDVDEEGNPVKKPNPNRRKRRCGFINEALWICGGLDRNLLRMCPTDWAKKAGMGGTILGTAVLASFSGGFAAYTVADGAPHAGLIALIVGIIWGLVIFNLDRYLVNSMYSDGEPTISKQEFKSGLPRIIIAFFLGIVISTPIELKIFEGEIKQELHNEQSNKIDNENNIFAKNPSLHDLKDKVDDLKSKYDEAFSEYQKRLNVTTNEIWQGNGTRNKGKGPVAEALEADAQLYNSTVFLPIKTEYETIKQSYDTLYAQAMRDTKTQVEEEVGLSKKIELLLRATSFHKYTSNQNAIVDNIDATGTVQKKEFNKLFLVRLLIALMFIILEILPVVNKMMQTDGEYDKLIDLESDTRAKLTRAKSYNNIIVTLCGNLSPFTNQIIFGQAPNEKDESFKGLIFENTEAKTPFAKTDYKKDSRNETDADNYEIYKYAREVCTKYVKGRIDKLFAGSLPQSDKDDFKTQDVSIIEPDKGKMTSSDPSNDAIKI